LINEVITYNRGIFLNPSLTCYLRLCLPKSL